ncbi:protein shuttle craft-like [Maniola hyperantus]|uniref:protein shuttle craft-like n=1 Tax=Aphantopus hyperantus TaxID=2795564 RepID=UPI0015689A89|nr:protein shuttle craft [Maniola hyperantus]
MSQWNNSYNYNNQYQAPNTWNEDYNTQYLNQSQYYPNPNPNRQYDPNRQYVGFDEFVSQMQMSNVPASNTASYNNVQYQNYPNAQYNNIPSYQNGSTPQNSQADYAYGSSTANFSNNEDVYQPSVNNQYNRVPDKNNYSNEMVSKSKLTPTATEFVPKSSNTNPVSSQNEPILESNLSNLELNGSTSNYSKPSSSNNWRERPKSSQQRSNSSHLEPYSQKHSKNQEPSRNSKYESRSQNQESTSHGESTNQNSRDTYQRETSSRTSDSNTRNRKSKNRPSDNQDSTYRRQDNQEYNSRNKNSDSQNQDVKDSSYRRQDKNQEYNRSNRNSEYNSQNQDARDSSYRRQENQEYNNRPNRNSDRHSHNQDSKDTSYRRQDNQDYNSRSNRHNDYNTQNQDQNQYSDQNDTDFGDYEGGQSKNNSKAKNKESDVYRTFYNSSMPKDSQDVRSGRGEGSGRNRKWAGTQRLRAPERTEDEQYANSYSSYREEKFKDTAPSPSKGKNRAMGNHIGANTDMTQRERLSEQLDKGTLECLVCCERVKQTDSVWYCSNCHHVLHLRCIRKWAMSSLVESKWRCPACQNTNQDIPTEYRCMCGSVRNPEYQRGSNGAHTCGQSCSRTRNCTHPCTLLCHPGPCPPCQATVIKQCGCGAETRSVMCSSKLPQVCGRECKRTLECGVHFCSKDCHEGPCDPCAETVTQACHCPAAKSRSVPCTAETGSCDTWSCESSCGRVLSCGAHVCRSPCHPPPCPLCPLRPENVPACPCGHTRISKDQRKSCTDPIPLCGNICAKPLSCGPVGDKHFCKEKCHEGECRVCPDNTLLQCRCGHSSREVPCADLPEMHNNVLCQRKCNKKLSCGRHRCRTVCCDAQSHRCAVVCGRTLSCQLHRCEEFCHTGHCAPCPRVSFDELHCECGAEVIMPPVRCGTKPPACNSPCRRERPCGHPPHHSCHSGDCPPCVVLTTKSCYGRHEERKTIPCSQEEFSCGLPCGKPLPCGKHSCIKTCHKGSCDAGKCTQPCMEKRPSCGHPCSAPCHSSGGGTCPSGVACRRPVTATCPCGRRKAERACVDNARDYAKLMSTLAASKMQEGGTLDLSDVQRPGSMLKTLECDEECYVEARSRRLALALQLRNPDVSAKLAPRYSEHLRQTAAREPSFAQQVHERLTELVQLAKKSKQKTRAHSFPSMNRQKRQFIHELCEHFGCESVAYDAEPNRNVVATADKEKSWLPAMSVLEVLAREAGKRKVPGPVLRTLTQHTPVAPAATPLTSAASKSSGGWATLTTTNAWAARSQPKQLPRQPTQEAKIDYFDNPPDN